MSKRNEYFLNGTSAHVGYNAISTQYSASLYHQYPIMYKVCTIFFHNLIDICITCYLDCQNGPRTIKYNYFNQKSIHDFPVDDNSQICPISAIIYEIQMNTTLTCTLEWAKIKCKNANQKAKHDFLFDDNSDICLSVSIYEI